MDNVSCAKQEIGNKESIKLGLMESLIHDTREKRKKLLIEKIASDSIKTLMNNEPDIWVLISVLISRHKPSYPKDAIFILDHSCDCGDIQVFATKDGVFVKSTGDDEKITTVILQNKMLETLVKKIMFFFHVMNTLSKTVGNIQYICDVDDCTLDTRPLLGDPKEVLVMKGVSYGGKELMYYFITEIIKP